MTELENEMLEYIKNINITLERVYSKMDEIKYNPFYSSDSDPGSDSENEEIKPEELTDYKHLLENKKFKIAYGHLVENNTHYLSTDIYNGIEDICMYMDKHFINPMTADLSFDIKDKKLPIDEYNQYIENTINNIISEIPKFLEPKLNKLREILLEKYINKDEIEKVEPFWKYGESMHHSIVN